MDKTRQEVVDAEGLKIRNNPALMDCIRVLCANIVTTAALEAGYPADAPVVKFSANSRLAGHKDSDSLTIGIISGFVSLLLNFPEFRAFVGSTSYVKNEDLPLYDFREELKKAVKAEEDPRSKIFTEMLKREGFEFQSTPHGEMVKITPEDHDKITKIISRIEEAENQKPN